MSFRKLTILVISLLVMSGLAIYGQELPTATASMTDDLNSLDGWTVDSADNWSVVDGNAVMLGAVGRGGWHQFYMTANDGGISGDFSLTANVGFNIDAYPMDTDEEGNVTGINWQGVYYRSIAVGLFQDDSNYLFAAQQHSSAGNNGIISNGSWLFRPWAGQGISQEIQDVRPIKVERSGLVTTVYLDGDIAYQGTDTTAAPATAGWASISTRGPTGLKVDMVSLSPSVSSPPSWDGPQVVTDAVFLLNEGGGYKLLSTDGMTKAVVEGVTTGDNKFASWMEDGASEGNRSVNLNVGQLNIQGVSYGPAATVEGWVKLTAETSYIFYFMVSAPELNEAWNRLRGGLNAEEGSSEDVKGVAFHWGMVESIVAEDAMTVGEWHHVAIVRDAEFTTLYVDFEEVGSGENTFADLTIPGVQITCASNADHDGVTSFSDVGHLNVDQIAITSQVLDPDTFVLLSGTETPGEPNDTGSEGGGETPHSRSSDRNRICFL